MKKSFFNIELEKEIIVFSSFITFYLLYWFYSKTDFSLTNFSNLYISQATLDGIDISSRVKLFYQAVISAFVLFPLIYFFFFKIKSNLQIRVQHLRFPLVIAATGLFLIVSDILGIESKSGITLSLLLFIISIILIGIKKSKRNTEKLDLLFPSITVISFIILSGILFLFNSNQNLIKNSVWYFIVVALILTIVIYFVNRSSGIFFRKIFRCLLPLTFVPLFIFISVELCFYFKIKYDFFIHYKLVFLGLIGFSFLCFYIYNLKKPINISSSKMFFYFFVPAALLSFLILIIYNPIIEQSKEIFELANPANAQMRMFAFHEIPFVDFSSSHMFSEQFYGIIHNLIYGYKGDLSFLTYGFLYELIFFFIAYYFVFRLFKNSFLSLLFLITFPFVPSFFSMHLFFGMILFFAVRKLINKQNLFNYILFFLLVIFMLFWRLDTGSATFTASVIFLPLSFFMERRKINFHAFIKSFAIVILLIIVVTIIISLARSPRYLLANFKSVFHYASANQAHGYSVIFTESNQQFYIYHIIFPAVAVLLIMYIIYNLRQKPYPISKFTHFMLNSSLFLFIIFIANFQRGLVRHLFFVENNDTGIASTFYIAMVLFLISFIKTNSSYWKYLTFFSLSFASILFLKYFPIDKGKSYLEKFLTQPSIVNIDNYFDQQNYKGKIIYNDEFAEQNYNEFKQFLDKNLSSDQTFLDFSNSPMLYYYCQRRVPSYFCQSLQNSIDDYLQLQHLKNVNMKNVPVVIYSNYPPNGLDDMDGVPTVMRQYIIAEYIFSNYKPYGIINDRSIWISKDKDFDWPIKQRDTLVLLPKTYNYKKAAAIISKHFSGLKHNKLEYIEEEKPLTASDKDYSLFEIKPNISGSPAVFVKVILSKPLNMQEIKVDLMSDNGVIGTNLFTTTGNDNEYMMMLSNHYFWHIKTAKYLRISNIDGLGISKVEFYKDMRNEY